MNSNIRSDDSWICHQCNFENELIDSICFNCGSIKKVIKSANADEVEFSNIDNHCFIKRDSVSIRTQSMNAKSIFFVPIRLGVIMFGYILGLLLGVYFFIFTSKFFDESELTKVGLKLIGLCIWIGVGRAIKSWADIKLIK
jgi:hypothetical protein